MSTTTERIRVLLAGGYPLIREGLRSLVLGMTGLTAVGEAADAREIVRLFRSERPDVVVVDMAVSGFENLGALSRETRHGQDARIVAVAANASEDHLAHVLAVGATSLVLKQCSATELDQAIRATARGEPHLSPGIPESVRQAGRTRVTRQASLGALTSRQRAVLQLIAESATTKEIALRLKVSVKTVEFHRARLMKRLGIHDVPGLVRFAIRMGLVPLEPAGPSSRAAPRQPRPSR